MKLPQFLDRKARTALTGLLMLGVAGGAWTGLTTAAVAAPAPALQSQAHHKHHYKCIIILNIRVCLPRL